VSHPFGGHPTLERFVEWAKTSAGCKTEIKVRTRQPSGQPYQVLEITNPAGGRVVVVDPEMGEHLAPSTVAYYQRRLAIKSPFAATPEQPMPAIPTLDE
jgi:hypothetical protein